MKSDSQAIVDGLNESGKFNFWTSQSFNKILCTGNTPFTADTINLSLRSPTSKDASVVSMWIDGTAMIMISDAATTNLISVEKLIFCKSK